MKTTFRIAVIPGDGIGTEVVPQGMRALEAAGALFDIGFVWDHFDWSCQRFAQTGAMMPADGLKQIADHDAIYLGAVGYPGVPDDVSLWGLLIPIRRGFDQWANVRPVRMLPGIRCPLADRGSADINMIVVRENSEGEYSDDGGIDDAGTDTESVWQRTRFSRKGIDRILRYAFEVAATRPRKQVTSATKSNGIRHTMPYWDQRFAAIAREFPDIQTNQYHIDILCSHFVNHPDWFDVVVASNLFGDILSDLGPGITGTIAVAPSANLNPERRFPSMFEPVHGSAPDIAGQGIANPIGQIWAGAMMLQHLGQPAAAQSIIEAFEGVLADGKVRTPDIGGSASCREMGQTIADRIRRPDRTV